MLIFTTLQHSFGNCDLAVAWFRSYLTDRKQTVCVNGIYSDPSALMHGVPQGSVPGPILFVLYATPVSDIMNYYSLHRESFSDNTQLHQSAHITELDQLISRIQDCITDLKTWMIHNKLWFNDDKTELMLATPTKFHNHPSLPPSMHINQVDIYFSPSVRSIGVVLDQTLPFKKHVLSICRVANLELRRISTIRHFVLSRIDYCNSLLAGIPKYLLDRLKKETTTKSE